MSLKDRISGIICEFNPLHYGHRYILEKSKLLGPVVCVMSGNFVQRGEPAIIDKWSRAELALRNGADLVLELPLPWACSGAENFAAGAVHILNALNLNGYLVFGSEAGEVEPLEKISRSLLSDTYTQLLKVRIKNNGETFAKIRETSIKEHLGEKYSDIIKEPNNILGIEYIKALISEKSLLKPVTIKRKGAGHGEKISGNNFKSAQEIREIILSCRNYGNLIPESTNDIISRLVENGHAPASIYNIEIAILCKLRTISKEDFLNTPDVSEGLESRIYNAVRKAASLGELYNLIKTKRYTHARIRRIIINSFLDITNALPKKPPYIRILGMNKTGEDIIKAAKPSLPICSKSNDFKMLGGNALELFELESRADDIYAMSVPNPLPCGLDYTKKLIKL